jgi:hypothetical protein
VVGMIVREAKVSDATGIALVHVESWKDYFIKILEDNSSRLFYEAMGANKLEKLK